MAHSRVGPTRAGQGVSEGQRWRARLTKRILVGGGVVVAVLAALHVYNYIAPGSRRARDQCRADPEPTHAPSATRPSRNTRSWRWPPCPPNPMNGPFYRLDDMLDRAVVKQEPPPIAAEQHGGRRTRVRRSGEARPQGRAGWPRDQHADGMLEVTNDPDDYLENAVELAVPRDEIGDLVIRMKSDSGTFMRLAWTNAEGPARRQDLAGQARRALHRHQGFPHLRHQCPRRDAAWSASAARTSPGSISSHRTSRAPRSSIDYIRFISKAARYAASPHGVGYESIAGEMRHAMFMRPDQELRVRAQGPRAAAAPRFRHGRAARRPSRCGSRSALTRPDGVTAVLHDETDRGHRALARRAGRPVAMGRSGRQDLAAQHRRSGQRRLLGQPDRVLGAEQAVQRHRHDRGR